MKRTFTSKPVIPAGYTGRDYNNWQNYLQKQLDKLYANDEKNIKNITFAS